MAGKYRRPVTAEQKEKAAQAREAKLEGLHKTLTAQVSALADGPQWRAWLTVAAKFHQYSFNNTALLMAQNPDATQVGGYNLWQQLGRQVTKGEKGLMVLAPVTRKLEPATTSPASSQPSTQSVHTTPPARTAELAEPARHAVLGYRPVYVWDVSQTTGDPLPTPPAPQLLAGQAPEGLWDALTAQCEAAGFTVARQPIAGDLGPNGYTSFDDREIVVRSDVDDAQAVKTLSHELGHALLHDPGTFAGGTTAGCRGTQEVEAESLAFLVCAEHGLDSGEYTFPYVAGWARQAAAGGDLEKVIRDTATRVLATARHVLTATEAHLHPASLEDLAAAAQADAELTARVDAGVQRTGDLRELASPADHRAPAAPSGGADVAQRDRLIAVNAAAVTFFADNYPTSWARGYLQHRLGSDLVDNAASPLPRVGYAPPGWKNLTEHLHRQGFTDLEILTAGLGITARTGQVVDRFRDRLMFPVRDHPGGDVVGFVGRRNPAQDDASTAGTEQNPKYLNTGHTPLYSKGEHLFGLAEGGGVLKRGGVAVLVEGPVDALAVDLSGDAALAGISLLGTALTHRHAALLRAVVPVGSDRVVVATDADQAGRDAAARAYQVLTAHLLDPRAANLAGGLDPARVLELHGPARLAAELTQAEPMPRQLVDRALSDRDLTWAEDRVAAARDAAAIISRAPADTWQREAAAVAASTGLDRGLLTEVLVETVGVGDDAVGRLAARDRRDDLDRGQHLPPTAADLAAMSFRRGHPNRITPWRPRPAGQVTSPVPSPHPRSSHR